MNAFPEIWNVLHDGSIVAVSGRIPGEIRLSISIDYLRERFADPGKLIFVTLANCTHISFTPFGAANPILDTTEIVSAEPEILSAKFGNGRSVICCVSGILEVEAKDGDLALDSGHSITLQTLIDVSDAYWTEWAEAAKKARGES